MDKTCIFSDFYNKKAIKCDEIVDFFKKNLYVLKFFFKFAQCNSAILCE